MKVDVDIYHDTKTGTISSYVLEVLGKRMEVLIDIIETTENSSKVDVYTYIGN